MIASETSKAVVVIYTDRDRSLLGTRSRAAEPWGDTTVLAETVRRAEQIACVRDVLVFCPAAQQSALQTQLAETGAIVMGLQQPVEVSKQLSRRKWALTSWRGGLGEATQFDEFVFTHEMLQQLQALQVETVITIAAEAVYLDSDLMSRALHHHEKYGESMRFTFTQAAPGLAGGIFHLSLINDIVLTGTPVSEALRYSPDSPQGDFINQECNYRIGVELIRSRFRYIADTQRSFNLLQKARQQGIVDDTAALVQFIDAQHENTPWPPREIELEIYTEPSLRVQGYPHNQPPQVRGPIEPADIKAFLEPLADVDDLLVTLGGCGEPLAHPQLHEVLTQLKDAGVFGINIETDGGRLQGEMVDMLLDSAADTISVFIDADSPDGYRQAKGTDGFEQTLANMETYLEKRNQHGGGPLLVPHMVKIQATMGEMEGFYNRWIRACGQAVIVGYTNFAGEIPSLAVMDMAPPQRFACPRLNDRLTILADGTVVSCSEDVTARQILGQAKTESLVDIWHGKALAGLRQMHRDHNYADAALCNACTEWHRF